VLELIRGAISPSNSFLAETLRGGVGWDKCMDSRRYFRNLENLQ
jgi:hypothetical protein